MFELKVFPTLIDDKGNITDTVAIKSYFSEIKQITNEKGLVLLLTSNTVEDVILYIYCLKYEFPVMLINEEVDSHELSEIIEQFQPGYIFTGHLDFNNSSSLQIRSKALTVLKQVQDSDIDPNLALLLTTSGSTGKSKFVRISRNSLHVNTQDIASYLPIEKEDVSITSLPIFYTYGLSIVNLCLFSGNSLVVTNKSVIQREFWDAFESHKVTSMSGVPYTYTMLNRVKFFKKNHPNLRYLTQAGGRLERGLKEKVISYAEDQGVDFFVMYGQTEATARISYVPPKQLKNKVDSIGLPVNSGKIEIQSPDENGVGELVYKGANVCLGYATSFSDLNAGDVNKGVLHTGDIGYLDADGFAYITGRKSRFVKIFGARVGLDTVESMVEMNFENTEVICTGDDNKIELKVNSELESSEIKKFVATKFKIHPSAVNVIKLDSLNRNAFGKKIYEN